MAKPDKKGARAAAAAAAQTLNQGTAAGTIGSDTGDSGETGKSSGNAETPAASSGPTTAPSPTNGESKGKKEKTDIFGPERLQTCVGLRKALWSTTGAVHITLKSGKKDYSVEVVKKSIINHLEAIIKEEGETAKAPWIFTHRYEVGSKNVVGCLLTDPGEVMVAGSTATVPPEKTVVTHDEQSTGATASGTEVGTKEQEGATAT